MSVHSSSKLFKRVFESANNPYDSVYIATLNCLTLFKRYIVTLIYLKHILLENAIYVFAICIKITFV